MDNIKYSILCIVIALVYLIKLIIDNQKLDKIIQEKNEKLKKVKEERPLKEQNKQS